MAKNSLRLVHRSKLLRQSSTDAERRLWRLLRSRQLAGAKSRRQYPCGPYVLDFFCFEHKLVIEVDGGQHKDDEQIVNDKARARYLEERGMRVMRFSNLEVLRGTEGVAEAIRQTIERPSP